MYQVFVKFNINDGYRLDEILGSGQKYIGTQWSKGDDAQAMIICFEIYFEKAKDLLFFDSRHIEGFFVFVSILSTR